ncbi:MAG: amidohydrolase family protein [bacterium]|nr:amidohydrolase family protein [bacterium]
MISHQAASLRYLLLITLIAHASCWHAADNQLRADTAVDLLIVGGHFFDTEQLEFKQNRGIAVRDGRLVGIDIQPENYSPEQTLNLPPDHYILPGLVDLHAHYNLRLFKIRREEFEVIPVVYLANGATTTFSAGEYDPEGMDQLRQRIENGVQIGPRLLTSGPYFGSVRPGWERQGQSAEEIRRDVKQWAARGVAGFKAKGIRYDELKALIEAAHEHGLTVTGHLGSGFRGSVNPRDAILLGIDRVEHFLGGEALPASRSAYDSLENVSPDMPEIMDIIRLYVEQGVWFDATISAYGYFGSRGEVYEQWQDERSFFTPYVRKAVESRQRKAIEQFEKIFQVKQKTIKAFFDAGGKITLGTDHFSDGDYMPGFGVHRELDVLVRNGIPPAEAIKIGSLNGALAMGIEADCGSLTQGKLADAYIIQGNPLEDIRNTRKGVYVLRAGKLHPTQTLLDSVRGKLGPKDASEQSQW